MANRIKKNLTCPYCGNVVRNVIVTEGSSTMLSASGVCSNCKKRYNLKYNGC